MRETKLYRSPKRTFLPCKPCRNSLDGSCHRALRQALTRESVQQIQRPGSATPRGVVLFGQSVADAVVRRVSFEYCHIQHDLSLQVGLWGLKPRVAKADRGFILFRGLAALVDSIVDSCRPATFFRVARFTHIRPSGSTDYRVSSAFRLSVPMVWRSVSLALLR